jgi:hypothetical protein
LPFKRNLQRYAAANGPVGGGPLLSPAARRNPAKAAEERRKLWQRLGASSGTGPTTVGLCTLNSFDPYPINYSLSNP